MGARQGRQRGSHVALQLDEKHRSRSVAADQAVERPSDRIGIEQGRISYTTAISFFNSVVGFVLLLISNWFSKKFGGNNLF